MTTFIARWSSGTIAKWRSLSWKEFRQFQQCLSYQHSIEVNFDLYRLCLLEGPAPEMVTAGIVEFIGRALMARNPFAGRYADVQRALDLKRTDLKNDFFISARALIAGIFHSSFEEIDTWDADIFFERLAQVEYVVGRKIEPGNPEEERSSKKQQPSPATPKKEMTRRQEMVMDRARRAMAGSQGKT